MKREELKELGLTDEQVEGVMVSHGKTVQSLNTQLATTKSDVDKLQEQLNERDADIQELSKQTGNQAELQEQISTLQAKYEEAQTENQKSKLVHAIDLALVNEVHDADIVRGQLNMESLSIDEKGNIVGLDEQVKGLKDSKAFLFKNVEPAGDNKKGNFFGSPPATNNSTSPKNVSLGTMIGKKVASKEK